MYQPRRQSCSQWLSINQLHLHLRHWSKEGGPKLLLLHGWLDASATFQFLVDELSDDWDIYALDWRGMGLSEKQSQGYYDRANMLSDLHQIIAKISNKEPLHALGHSLGGMLLSIYAGTFPHFFRSVILAEGFGTCITAQEKVSQMAKYLHESIKQPNYHHKRDQQAYIRILREQNPGVNQERALYISEALLQEVAGQWILRADNNHRISQPFPYSFDYYRPFWQRISSPVLWLQGDENIANRYLSTLTEVLDERYNVLSSPRKVVLKGTGHMMHWEVPKEMAIAVEQFLREIT